MSIPFTTSDVIDPFNLPSLVTINGFQLPVDVMITLNNEKVIAESKILDGVAVFERVSRNPMEINFEFTVRQKGYMPQNLGEYIFPAEILKSLMDDVWLPNAVLTIKNTFLNKIGIIDVIVKSVTIATVRGSTNVPVSLHCLENYNTEISQNTLIIT